MGLIRDAQLRFPSLGAAKVRERVQVTLRRVGPMARAACIPALVDAAMLLTIGAGLLSSDAPGVPPAPGASSCLAPSTAVTYTDPRSEGARTPEFGRDYPNGAAAVDYAYRTLWDELQPGQLEYAWNFYHQYRTAAHPADPQALVAYANGQHMTTARDANGHLLYGIPGQDGIDPRAAGGDFFEHDGIGADGARRGAPFTQFWYDDNYLARYMSEAYQRPDPSGLVPADDFTRWSILSGAACRWKPYGEHYPDTLALDGMYYLSKGDLDRAESCWTEILGKSGARFDAAGQRFDYPDLKDNYYLGLFAILTQRLMDSPGVSPGRLRQLTQHEVSLRSQILDQQQRVDGQPAGWLTGQSDRGTLINTETTAMETLALGSDAWASFEMAPGPMAVGPGCFLRPYHVLSAVAGESQPGVMVRGPGMELPSGRRRAEVYLRAPRPEDGLATIQVLDHGRPIKTQTLRAADFGPQNEWQRVSVPFDIHDGNSVEVEVSWSGQANLDLSTIQFS